MVFFRLKNTLDKTVLIMWHACLLFDSLLMFGLWTRRGKFMVHCLLNNPFRLCTIFWKSLPIYNMITCRQVNYACWIKILFLFFFLFDYYWGVVLKYPWHNMSQQSLKSNQENIKITNNPELLKLSYTSYSTKKRSLQANKAVSHLLMITWFGRSKHNSCIIAKIYSWYE